MEATKNENAQEMDSRPFRFSRLICLLGCFLISVSFLPWACANDESPLPETCYLFAYFINPGKDGLHLAWSRDGLKWSVLNDGKSYLKPPTEDSVLRDPCLFLGPDNVFRLVWTTGRPKRIGYASSNDLINWSAPQEPLVMGSEPTCRNCWAPIVIYDKAHQCYQLVWSSTVPGMFRETDNTSENGFNHRFYGTTTTDFVNFTPTKIFYDPGFSSIDANILPANNQFYLIFKNETLTPICQKNLWMASSQAMAGPYGDLTGTIATNPPAWVEGPTGIKIGDEYILYYDCYKKDRFGAVRSKHFRVWEDISSKLVMPPEIRHGSVLAVPSSVVARLLEPGAR